MIFGFGDRGAVKYVDIPLEATERNKFIKILMDEGLSILHINQLTGTSKRATRLSEQFLELFP